LVGDAALWGADCEAVAVVRKRHGLAEFVACSGTQDGRSARCPVSNAESKHTDAALAAVKGRLADGEQVAVG
jgi:hypothetical protein